MSESKPEALSYPLATMVALIGLFMLIAGIYALTYHETTYFDTPFGTITKTEYPYKDYAFPLIIISIICFIASPFIYEKEKSQTIYT